MQLSSCAPTMTLPPLRSIRTVKTGYEGDFDFTDAHHLKHYGIGLRKAETHARTTAARFRDNPRTQHVEIARLVIARKLKHLIRLFSTEGAQ